MIAGRYSLRDEIGRGGMGVVWRAEDEVLLRTVALKKVGMTPGGVSPDLRRAEREARLAARLNHPHVVAVFDLAVDGDEQWLVMEYVESRNLADLIRTRGPLAPDRAAALMAQAADALAAAHGAGIVHRDVKPSNILVTSTGQVKLTDFGIARAHADVTLTGTGLVSGSPAYLSPEVAAGGTATAASDVWALGATLFHALEGRPPFETGGNLVGTLYQIVHEEPPRSTRAGWLAPLLLATMTKDPEQRWPMREVLATLQRGPGPGLEPEATRLVTGAVPAPSPRVADPTPTARTSVVTPTPSAARPAPRRPRRDSRRGLAWLLPVLTAALLVAVVVLGWRLLTGNDSPEADNPSGGAPGSTTPPASGTPSPGKSASGTPSPGESASGTPPTADSMTAFAQDYVATATSDTKAGFDLLTPAYQKASGGYRGYREFWGRYDSASLRDVRADPEAMTVSYGVTYSSADGGSFDDEVTLRLVRNGDGFLIAGAS